MPDAGGGPREDGKVLPVMERAKAVVRSFWFAGAIPVVAMFFLWVMIVVHPVAGLGGLGLFIGGATWIDLSGGH